MSWAPLTCQAVFEELETQQEGGQTDRFLVLPKLTYWQEG